jgi:hypothetical protein
VDYVISGHQFVPSFVSFNNRRPSSSSSRPTPTQLSLARQPHNNNTASSSHCIDNSAPSHLGTQHSQSRLPLFFPSLHRVTPSLTYRIGTPHKHTHTTSQSTLGNNNATIMRWADTDSEDSDDEFQTAGTGGIHSALLAGQVSRQSVPSLFL